ncbi:MAG: fumarate reductase/succinate dehydrogenase flavoprotein subunit, partial [Gemmatimonadaceae bacterium]
ANRLGGNSLSDLLVFGQRAGEYAAMFARSTPSAAVREGDVDRAVEQALAPFDRATTIGAESPYAVQQALEDMMQDLVGIVRIESEMLQALDGIAKLRARAAKCGVQGNREYNPGWHTALDLPNMLTVSEAITRSALERKESRGAQFRNDYPEKSATYATFNIVVRRGANGAMELERVNLPELPNELKQVIEEQK